MNIKHSIFALILFLIGFNSNQVLAQGADAKFTHTKIINSSADAIWEIIRELDNVDKYSSNIAKVVFTGNKGVGGERVCTSPDGKGYFKEKILGYDDDNRLLTYAVTEGVPLKGLVNNMKIVDLGYNKSMLVFWSDYEAFMQNPQMTEAQFLGFMEMSLEEMITKMEADAS